ncbi:DNA replication complex GINS protein SLD5-like [Argiope bruennichi]|uniref:DNA replication complex GINS protein SLD5-like n=1 Tax=Argiope bruennichi TaxID=94029 RepID=UPI002494AB34|nr:DNA replication complex GINS protein SLD5-like [Argiope bruennichi]
MDPYEDDAPEDNETEEGPTLPDIVEKLEEVWVNEKLAPDLLQYESDVVEIIFDQIQHMETNLQKIEKKDFRVVFHEMELDRIKYVLSSYLRIRLEKIEKFGFNLLHQESQDETNLDLMSEEERNYAQEFTSNVKKYLHVVALKNMPVNMQNIKFEEICSKAQMDRSVFIKVKTDCPGVVIEDFSDYGEEEIVDLAAQSQHILRYRPVASLLKSGALKLI